MGETYLTKEGFEKLDAERASLLRQKRELTEEVSQAAAMGDLRENSEYHAARERLEHVSKRLAELDGKLRQARIIDDALESSMAPDEARVGATVTLHDEQADEQFSYLLVAPEEADPKDGKLSIASPLGKAMLGKKTGERFMLTLPKAIVPYRLVSVTRTT
jgi:transcription elongation factor GreA